MEEGEQKRSTDGSAVDQGGNEDGAAERERVIRETREAGMRAEGGGSADEADIRAAAEETE